MHPKKCFIWANAPLNVKYGNTTRADCFHGNGGGQILGNAVLAGTVITLWVVCLMLPFFMVLKAVGLFRVSDEVKDEGLDISKHGGAAYEIGMDDSKAKDVEASNPAKTA